MTNTLQQTDKQIASTMVNDYYFLFRSDVGLTSFLWAIGSPFKKTLPDYPHLFIDGDKGSGVTTLLDALIHSLDLKDLTIDDFLLEIEEVEDKAPLNGMPLVLDQLSNERLYDYDVPVLIVDGFLDINPIGDRFISLKITKKDQYKLFKAQKFPLDEWLKFIDKLEPSDIQKTLKYSVTRAFGNLAYTCLVATYLQQFFEGNKTMNMQTENKKPNYMQLVHKNKSTLAMTLKDISTDDLLSMRAYWGDVESLGKEQREKRRMVTSTLIQRGELSAGEI